MNRKYTIGSKPDFGKQDDSKKVTNISKVTKYRSKSGLMSRSVTASSHDTVSRILEAFYTARSIERLSLFSLSYKSEDLEVFSNKLNILLEEPVYNKSTRIHEIISQNFNLINATEIFDFVSREAKLVGFLIDAKTKIRSFFPNIRLQLEHVVDPEVQAWEKLWIKIPVQVTTDPDCEKFDKYLCKLDELDEQWWLDVPFEIRQVVSIDLEFHEI
ncbi:MAG: hypothetical protein ACTS2F_06380 [Thainema sp.]